MSVLKSLSFVAVPKHAAADPKILRRNKLLTQLQQQLALAKDESFVVRRQKWVKHEDGSKQLVDLPKRVKRWWRVDDAGNCYLIVRYGNKVISPSPDRAAIAVGRKDNLAATLEAVISATQAGEFDTAIEAVKAINRDRIVKRKAA